MSFRRYYGSLAEALQSCYSGKPVPTNDILSWIKKNRDWVVEELIENGYKDSDDPLRGTGWSWRQYLANALSRMRKEGLVHLVGHSSEVPFGYFQPVGLWEPVDGMSLANILVNPVCVSVRLFESEVSKLREKAQERKVSLQTILAEIIQSYLGTRDNV